MRGRTDRLSVQSLILITMRKDTLEKCGFEPFATRKGRS